MNLPRAFLHAAAAGLRWCSIPFLVVGWIATPILEAAAACDRAAREWNPRLWARGEDPRSADEERP